MKGPAATSAAAGASVRPVAETLREQIAEHLRALGFTGATADEIETDLGMIGNTVRPRLVELRAKGRVGDSGRTRETRSGRKAVVWWLIA